MNRWFKNGINIKNVLVIVVCFIILPFLILPYLSNISVGFHENAHVEVGAEYGINLTYIPADLLTLIPETYQTLGKRISGIAEMTDEDKEMFCNLSYEQRRHIAMAGPISDIIISIYLSISMIFLIVIFVMNEQINQNKNWRSKIRIILSVLIVLLAFWLMQINGSTVLNLTDPCGDLDKIFNCRKCLGI